MRQLRQEGGAADPSQARDNDRMGQRLQPRDASQLSTLEPRSRSQNASNCQSSIDRVSSPDYLSRQRTARMMKRREYCFSVAMRSSPEARRAILSDDAPLEPSAAPALGGAPRDRSASG